MPLFNRPSFFAPPRPPPPRLVPPRPLTAAELAAHAAREAELAVMLAVQGRTATGTAGPQGDAGPAGVAGTPGHSPVTTTTGTTLVIAYVAPGPDTPFDLGVADPAGFGRGQLLAITDPTAISRRWHVRVDAVRSTALSVIAADQPGDLDVSQTLPPGSTVAVVGETGQEGAASAGSSLTRWLHWHCAQLQGVAGTTPLILPMYAANTAGITDSPGGVIACEWFASSRPGIPWPGGVALPDGGVVDQLTACCSALGTATMLRVRLTTADSVMVANDTHPAVDMLSTVLVHNLDSSPGAPSFIPVTHETHRDDMRSLDVSALRGSRYPDLPAWQGGGRQVFCVLDWAYTAPGYTGSLDVWARYTAPAP